MWIAQRACGWSEQEMKHIEYTLWSWLDEEE